MAVQSATSRRWSVRCQMSDEYRAKGPAPCLACVGLGDKYLHSKYVPYRLITTVVNHRLQQHRGYFVSHLFQIWGILSNSRGHGPSKFNIQHRDRRGFSARLPIPMEMCASAEGASGQTRSAGQRKLRRGARSGQASSDAHLRRCFHRFMMHPTTHS
jgi:hypothetical protein